MSPKKKDLEDKEKDPRTRKRLKKTHPAEDETGEQEAGADGPQLPTEGDLNKMYNAMQYEKKKTGNSKPLETYQALQTSKEKHSFWRNFLVDKKFSWMSVQESHTHTSSSKEEHKEGWMSKYQVAAEEKLPPDSELLEKLLAELPNRAHRTASWAAKGEKEYYYQAQGQLALSATKEHQLQANRHGKITQASFDQLTAGNQVPEKPAMALEDDKKVKVEPVDDQEAKTFQTYKDLQSKLKKLSKQMGDLAHEAVAHKTKLQERVDQGKTYLNPLLELLVQQVTTFQAATNTAIGNSATGGEPTLAAVGVLEKQLQEATSHFQAFKAGAYKEVLGIFK